MTAKNPTDSLAPETTEEQDKHTAGERRINLIWEYTQMTIALLVISLFVYIKISHGEMDSFTAGIIGLVIGFYFGRTNHTRIGDDRKA